MKHDVMKALAAARPEQLDAVEEPAVARARRERELGRAFRQEIGAAEVAGRARGRRPVRWAIAGTGVVAAGAAVAIAVSATGPGAPGGGAPGVGPRGEVDLGEQAVLVAAENAAKQEDGKYWFSDDLAGQSYVVRAGTTSYVMVGAYTESFRWAGAEPGSASGAAWRMLPARPQTPRDAAAWRKAGSPKKIRAWSGDKWVVLDTAAKPAWKDDGSDASGGGRWYGRMTTEEIQNLPSDPKKLTERFLTDEAMQWSAVGAPSPEKLAELEKERGPLPRREVDSFSKLGAVGGLIANSPVPPGVRAGLIRAATALPGVTAIGEATDPLGRKGVALASASRTVEVTGDSGAPPGQQGTYRARKELIFDKATGAVLASQYVLTEPGGPYKDRERGFVIDYMAVRDTGWTDARPTPPVKPPH